MPARRLLLILLVLSGIPRLGADEAQPKLPTATLTVGKKTVVAEVADEEIERQRGLMFRKTLGQDEGMLFLMDRPGPASFWMRNTSLPLSIAYINASGMILEIHDLEPFDETAVGSAFRTIAYALEMNRGWFEANGILPGDTIRGLPTLR